MSSSTPPDSDPAKLAAIETALFAGRKIEAIKHYREMTGLGLKESKEAVEQLEVELRAKVPEKFTSKAKTGCASVLVMGAGLAAFVLWRTMGA